MTSPAPSEAEEQIIVRERLRLLAIGFYVKGATCALVVSVFLIHFFLLLGISFIPESSWEPKPAPTVHSVSVSPAPSPSPRAVNSGPPVVMFRIFAGVIGLVILLGWTFGGLTAYAGRCVQKRTNRLFIYIMAGLNCPLIPWGTLLGIATFMLLPTPVARREFGLL
jgi:hypothetical protein